MKKKQYKCGTCKYWDNNGNYGVFPENLKDKYGFCNSGGFAYEDPEGDRIDMLIYGDYEGYSAGFSTGINFGCIHYARKDKP